MSSGGQIALRITAEEAQALSALGRLVQAQESATAATKRYTEANRQAAAEARALERDAGKIKEAVATPLERYQQELGRLKQLLGATKISQDEYNRAIEQANARYVANVQAQAASTEAAKARAAAEAEAGRREADAARQAARVKDSVRTADERYAQEVAELDDHLNAGRISQDEYNRAVEQSRQRLDEATGATARLRAEQAAAAKVTEATRTAEERYGQEIAELDALLRAGRINQDQYNRALEQAENRLNDATGATARMRQAEQDAARVREQVRTPTERYNTTLERLRQHLNAGRISQDEYNRSVARADDELRKAQTSGDAAFGANALGSLKSYAAGFVSLTAAIGLANRALSDMEETRKEAAEKQKFSRLGIGELAQVADSPEDMKRLIATAEQVYRGGGAADMSEAARVVFAAKSAGAMQEVDLVTQLKASGLVSTPDLVMKAASTLYTAMGKEETGSIRDIISKSFGAAREAPGTVPQLLEAVARSGASARAIGLSDEELMAATAIASKAAGTESEGGTQVYSLIRSLTEISATRPEMRGKNLMQMLKSVQAMNLPEDQLQQLMGRAEALNAYRVLLQNEQMMQTLTDDTTRAQASDEVGKRLGFFQVDKRLGAALKIQQATAQEELSRTQMGTRENVEEASLLTQQAAMRQAGVAPALNWAYGMGSRINRKIAGFAPSSPLDLLWGPFGREHGKSQMADEFQLDRGAVPPPPPPPPPSIQSGTDRETIGVLRDIRDESRKQNQKLDQLTRPGRLGNPDVDR